MPTAAWIALGWYGANQWARRHVPTGLAGVLVRSTGASLADAKARWFYPHRIKGEHLIMFYDNRITDPQGDMARMEKYLRHLEALTQSRLREKVYWVRGAFHGNEFAMYGIAIATSQSPCGVVDFHEVAHVFLNQHRLPGARAPMALVEGWAESQSRDRRSLSQAAVSFRRRLAHGASDWPAMSPGEKQRFLQNHADPWGWKKLLDSPPDSLLRVLMTDAFWTSHDAGPVYSVGGAFVDFFIQRYGFAKFRQLYSISGEEAFDAASRKLCGKDSDALEAEFWDYAEHTASGKR
jgi:hypothetical protein